MNEIDLDKLHEYAAALLSPAEIAILMDIAPEDRSAFCIRCRDRVGDPLYETFYHGRLTTKLELRQNVIKLAKAGSPAAEPLAERYLYEQNLD
jgi:hypothetical protein